MRAWVADRLVSWAGALLGRAGRLVQDEYFQKQIELILRGMWDAGFYVRRIDGSRFTVH